MRVNVIPAHIAEAQEMYIVRLSRVDGLAPRDALWTGPEDPDATTRDGQLSG